MLQAYLAKAMESAQYEIMEDGTFYGEIPPLRGVWAQGKTLEECRHELLEVAEFWLLLKIRDGDTLPVLGGIDLNIKAPAHAD
jgi:predicted RNase H-like HicB family nuclease